MTRIKPERVVEAAAAIAGVDLGNRTQRSTLQKFLVFRAIGVSKDSPRIITAQDVLGACDRLFGVAGRPPYNWYDPITNKWNTMQTNRGWPVGSPWPVPFPPPPPQPQPCSAGSQVLRDRPTSHARSSQAYRHWRSLSGPPGDHPTGEQWDLPVLALGGSVHARFFDRAGPTSVSHNATGRVAFQPELRCRHPEPLISRLNSPAYTYPCQRFACTLRAPTHDSGSPWVATPSA